MKVMQWLMYFVILNGVLAAFLSIGLFAQTASLGVPVDEMTSIISLSSFTSLEGLFKTALSVFGAIVIGYIGVLGGVDAFSCLAYAIMTGVFIQVWGTIFGVMWNIRNWMVTTTGSGASMDAVMVIIGLIFAVLFLYTLVQMARGGGESYE